MFLRSFFVSVCYLNIIFFCLGSAFCLGEERSRVAVIHDIETPFNLSPYLDILSNPKDKVTWESFIDDVHNDHMIQNEGTIYNGSEMSIKTWFRARFKIAEGAASQDEVTNMAVYLPLQPAYVWRLHIRTVTADGVSETMRFGFTEELDDKKLPGALNAFLIKVRPGETVSIVGVLDNSVIALFPLLSFHVVSEDGYDDLTRTLDGVRVSYYSIIICLWVYNLMLFLALRQASYGYYGIFLATIIWSISSIDGTLQADNRVLNGILLQITPVISMSSYIAFVYTALDKIYFAPRVEKTLRYLFFCGLAILIYMILFQNLFIGSIIMQVFAGLSIGMGFVAIAFALKHGYEIARYMLLAEMMVVLGSMGFVLTVQGVIEANRVTIWVLHFGMLAEGMLLSLVLAAQTRATQKLAIVNLQKYETLYQESEQGMFQLALPSMDITCNQSMARICGYNSIDEFTESFSKREVFDPRDFHYLFSEFKEHGYILDHEILIPQARTFSTIWVSVSIQTVKDEHGDVILLDGSLIDITQRKLKEAAERDSVALTAQSKAKTQFFASMSHEFRTPLTAILGYAKLAMRPEISQKERLENIKTIDRGGQHMLQLINDILDISKIEAQKMEVESIPVNLIELLKETHDYLAIFATEKEIPFVFEYNYPLPETIISDPTRLKQALINLASNAIKFTQQGRVAIAVYCDRENEKLSLEVSDTGIGLKQEQINKLFSAFTQADSSTSRSFGGTGLGLYLSKMISNKLGGDIIVESEYGKGSIFTLTIKTGPMDDTVWIESEQEPLTEESEQQSPVVDRGGDGVVQSEREHAEPKSVMRVLLADDNATNQKLVGFHIKQSGAEVVLADDGLDAVTAALRDDIDLVLMDMDMPVMDGMTAVKYLRDKGFTKPIYALTGNVTLEAIHECLELGCTGHLGKPIDTERLAEVLRGSA